MAAHREGTVLLNGVVYEIMPQSMRVSELATVPRVVEGSPSLAEATDDSQVGWNDWQDGAGAVTFSPSQPARLASARNVISDVPGQLTLSFLQVACTGMDEAPTRLAQLRAGDRMTGVSATKVWLKDDGADSWTAKLTGSTPKDLIAWGDGTNTLWLAALGNATAYKYTTDITAAPVTWVDSTLGGDNQVADFWAVGSKGSGSNGGTLWKAVLPNKVYATDDPKNTTGHWTSAYLVGGSESNITRLAVINDRLIVCKTDGVYWVKPDGTVQPIIDLSGAVDAANGNAAIGWGNSIWVNWVQGFNKLNGDSLLNLAEITTQFRDMGPHVGSQAGSESRGRVVATCDAPTRLYAVLQSESGNYSINRYNGHPTPGLGWNLGFLWLAENACNALGWEQPTTGNPRLYFGYGAGVRYVVMPKYGDNPLLDTGVAYCPSGTAEMSEYESPLPGMTKAMLYDGIDLERTAAGTRYADIAYKIDDDAVMGWSTLRRVDTDGLSKAYFSTSGTTGRRIKLQLTLATADSTNTPRVRLLEHHFEFRPARRQRWDFQVKSQQLWNRTKKPKAVRDALVAVRDSEQPVSWEDRYGDLWDVFVKNVGEAEWAKGPGKPEPEEVIGVELTEFKSGAGAYYVDDENALVGTASVA